MGIFDYPNMNSKQCKYTKREKGSGGAFNHQPTLQSRPIVKLFAT